MEQNYPIFISAHLRVIEYIYDHLDGDLSLDTLADVACYSRFHWHRVYHNMTGEPIAQTVRRLRFARAANELLRSDKSLHQIAKLCGFPSNQSFYYGFSAEMGISPSAYRKTGKAHIASVMSNKRNNKMYEVKIEDHKPRRLMTIPHKGSYMNIGQAFEKGVVYATQMGIKGREMIGVYYSDPSVVAEADLQSAAALTLFDGEDAPNGTNFSELAGGRYAVLLIKAIMRFCLNPMLGFTAHGCQKAVLQCVTNPPLRFTSTPQVTPSLRIY